MSKLHLVWKRVSRATQAFVVVGLLIIIIIILVWPGAGQIFILILGVLPALLNALAAYRVAVRPHRPNLPANSNDAPTALAQL